MAREPTPDVNARTPSGPTLVTFEGRSPQIHPDAWVAPTATLIGDVVVEAGASVWWGCVLRADLDRILVAEGANVQDGSTVHVDEGIGTIIGVGATVGHRCVVHSCVLGPESLIGNAAVVLEGASVGARTLVAAGSVVPPGRQLPDEVVAVGAPARVRGPLSGGAEWWVRHNPETYQALARRYAEAFPR